MHPVGQLRTPYRDKFGVPRQAGLAVSARARLVFEPRYRREEAIRGIEDFSHLWIVFLFHGVREEDVRLNVRPPRLGGNEKLGVFATRSPFRPNRLGLSVGVLEDIVREGRDAPSLVLSGLDVIDGTPVLDIKPYLPYADRIEEATAGYAEGRPAKLGVEVAAQTRPAFEKLPPDLQQLILDTLQWDGRPAYHAEGRDYYLRIDGVEVVWRVSGEVCHIVEVKAG